MDNTKEQFQKFVDVIAALRNPQGGCPWDLEQDHTTLRQYLIEEAYEVLDAIDKNDDAELVSELGDVLLQVVLHAQVAKDRGAFSIDEVIQTVREKMIRRHPHVFGDVKVTGSGEVLKNWEKIKMGEKGGEQSQQATSLLAGIPSSLPALLRAQRLGEKAAKVSFDWKSMQGVWDKVHEELQELQEEVSPHLNETAQLKATPEVRKRLEHELGDLFFSLCQMARWLGISAEDSLRTTADRFISRFEVMEKSSDKPLSSFSEDELEALWQKAKACEAQSS